MSVHRKKLPKAIRQPTDAMGEALAGHGATAPQVTLAHRTNMDRADDGQAAALEPGFVETPSVPPTSPTMGTVSRIAPAHVEMGASRRRSLANAIVERHAIYSGLGGIIPVPIANVASITAVIVRMVKVLSDLYGVPFERDRARAIVVGLMGGAMPTGLAAATTSTLMYIIPASGLIGLAVSSLAAVACTRSVGRIFVEHFENGAPLR